MPVISPDIAELLQHEARRINSSSFIADDPVQFPRRYDDLRDIEISALLCATIAWGNRNMICRSCNAMLSLMDNQPYRYVVEQGWLDLPDKNIHRTFFTANLRHYLAGLHRIYTRYASLHDYIVRARIYTSQAPAWVLADHINRAITDACGEPDSRCVPQSINTTALKRLNMAMRWLVRDDGIVDMGVWPSISPRQLYIPMDVHVGNASRQLGLLTRKSTDRRAVEQLTEVLRTLRPDDPVYFDYALFGIGMMWKNKNKDQAL